jgi:NitT/TauT family transport system ATP-binding protein
MEIVLDYKGRVDVFTLEKRTDAEFGHTLALVMAGEMLDFLDTPKEIVLLTDIGRRFLQQDIAGRQAILGEQLMKLDLFRLIVKRLQSAPERQLPKDFILEDLVMRVSAKDVEPLFDTIVAWGRSGELFGYDATTEILYLTSESPGASDGNGRAAQFDRREA